MVPDCTLITGCFNTNKFNQKTRTMEDIIKALGPYWKSPATSFFSATQKQSNIFTIRENNTV